MIVSDFNTLAGNTTTNSAQKTFNAKADTIGMNQFLTLLIAQLRHQDPLSPLDSAQFTAQLSQFASVEQMYATNEHLGGIKDLLQNQGEQQELVNLIGKNVAVDDNAMQVDGTIAMPGAYRLDSGGDVVVNVYNSAGTKVRTIYHGWQGPGRHDVEWDGLGDDGRQVPDGSYTFDAVARDASGNAVAADTFVSGEVTGVTYAYDQPYLLIGNRKISADAIREVSRAAVVDGVY